MCSSNIFSRFAAMKMEILAFGIAREIFGGKSTTVEGISDVSSLKKALEQQYPKLKELRSYMIAVNNEYADDHTLLNQGDEIAIIPPVSGG